MQLTGPLGEFHFLSFLVLLILSSTYARLGNLTIDFFLALPHLNTPQLKHIAGRFVLLVGEAIALRLADDLLERGVSPVFFFFLFLGTYWLTACHVAIRFDRESRVARAEDNGGGGRSTLTLTLTAVEGVGPLVDLYGSPLNH